MGPEVSSLMMSHVGRHVGQQHGLQEGAALAASDDLASIFTRHVVTSRSHTEWLKCEHFWP
jgi:hypothetical protein